MRLFQGWFLSHCVHPRRPDTEFSLKCWQALATVGNAYAVVCISSFHPHSGGAGESLLRESHHDLGSPSLAYAYMVLRPDLPCVRGALDTAHSQGPAVPGEGNNLAPVTRAMAAGGLAPERDWLSTSGLIFPVLRTIQIATHKSHLGNFVVPSIYCMFEQGCTFTLNVYLAAISACHVGWHGVTPGTYPLAGGFISGTGRLRTPPPPNG